MRKPHVLGLGNTASMGLWIQRTSTLGKELMQEGIAGGVGCMCTWVLQQNAQIPKCQPRMDASIAIKMFCLGAV